MGRWKLKSPLHAIKRGLTSLFVCAVVLLPIFLVSLQLSHVFGWSLTDKRKATPLPAMQVRTIDKTKDAIVPFQHPYLTVTFDDGWESVYTQAMPLLQKYGIPTTQYVLTGVEKDPGYMSFAQIGQMKAAGHELACHSVTHPDLTTLNHDDLIKQLTGCKQTLDKKYGIDVKDFASPYGSESPASVAGIKEVFRSERNTDGDITTNQADYNDINTLDHFNRYGITAITIRKETTQAQLQSAITYALQNNGWLVLNYHQVENGDDEYGIDMNVFESQLKAVSQAKMRIVTMGQFLDNLSASEAAVK